MTPNAFRGALVSQFMLGEFRLIDYTGDSLEASPADGVVSAVIIGSVSKWRNGLVLHNVPPP